MITAYAAHIEGEPGWHVDGARLPLSEIRRWFESSRRDVFEIRQIGEPFEGYDPPSWARSLAAEEGWWRDRLSHCWRAPDEFIASPHQEPTRPRH